jgi:hypothetical protein
LAGVFIYWRRNCAVPLNTVGIQGVPALCQRVPASIASRYREADDNVGAGSADAEGLAQVVIPLKWARATDEALFPAIVIVSALGWSLSKFTFDVPLKQQPRIRLLFLVVLFCFVTLVSILNGGYMVAVFWVLDGPDNIERHIAQGLVVRNSSSIFARIARWGVRNRI